MVFAGAPRYVEGMGRQFRPWLGIAVAIVVGAIVVTELSWSTQRWIIVGGCFVAVVYLVGHYRRAKLDPNARTAVLLMVLFFGLLAAGALIPGNGGLAAFLSGMALLAVGARWSRQRGKLDS